MLQLDTGTVISQGGALQIAGGVFRTNTVKGLLELAIFEQDIIPAKDLQVTGGVEKLLVDNCTFVGNTAYRGGALEAIVA